MKRKYELSGDLSQYDKEELAEYVDTVVQELIETRSQQLRLGKRVELLSGTVSDLARTLASLTQNYDQLDIKVLSLVLDVGQVRADSRQAMQTADMAIREVRHLRKETRRQFQQVHEKLALLGPKIDRFIDSVSH